MIFIDKNYYVGDKMRYGVLSIVTLMLVLVLAGCSGSPVEKEAKQALENFLDGGETDVTVFREVSEKIPQVFDYEELEVVGATDPTEDIRAFNRDDYDFEVEYAGLDITFSEYIEDKRSIAEEYGLEIVEETEHGIAIDYEATSQDVYLRYRVETLDAESRPVEEIAVFTVRIKKDNKSEEFLIPLITAVEFE